MYNFLIPIIFPRASFPALLLHDWPQRIGKVEPVGQSNSAADDPAREVQDQKHQKL